MSLALDLQRTIEEINLMQAPEAAQQSFFVLEQVMTMGVGLLKQDWKGVVRVGHEVIFNGPKSLIRTKCLAEWYNSFDIESCLEDPKCATCGAPAEKRCK